MITVFLIYGNYCFMFNNTKKINIHLRNCYKEKIIFILEKYYYHLLVCEIDICSRENGF